MRLWNLIQLLQQIFCAKVWQYISLCLVGCVKVGQMTRTTTTTTQQRQQRQRQHNGDIDYDDDNSNDDNDNSKGQFWAAISRQCYESSKLFFAFESFHSSNETWSRNCSMLKIPMLDSNAQNMTSWCCYVNKKWKGLRATFRLFNWSTEVKFIDSKGGRAHASWSRDRGFESCLGLNSFSLSSYLLKQFDPKKAPSGNAELLIS